MVFGKRLNGFGLELLGNIVDVQALVRKAILWLVLIKNVQILLRRIPKFFSSLGKHKYSGHSVVPLNVVFSPKISQSNIRSGILPSQLAL